MSRTELKSDIESYIENLKIITEERVFKADLFDQLARQFKVLSKVVEKDPSDSERLLEYCKVYIDYVIGYSCVQEEVTKADYKANVFKYTNALSVLCDIECLKNRLLENLMGVVTDVVSNPSVSETFVLELMRFFNNVARKCNETVREKLGRDVNFTIYAIIDSLNVCESYEYQTIALETVFLLCSKRIAQMSNTMFPGKESLQAAITAFDFGEFKKSSRRFLNIMNIIYGHIFSIVADSVSFERCSDVSDLRVYDRCPLWVDFNKKSLGIYCDDRNFFENSQVLEEAEIVEPELATVFYSNILTIDCIPLISGQMQFRFNLNGQLHIKCALSTIITEFKVLCLTFTAANDIEKMTEEIIPFINRFNTAEILKNSVDCSDDQFQCSYDSPVTLYSTKTSAVASLHNLFNVEHIPKKHNKESEEKSLSSLSHSSKTPKFNENDSYYFLGRNGSENEASVASSNHSSLNFIVRNKSIASIEEVSNNNENLKLMEYRNVQEPIDVVIGSEQSLELDEQNRSSSVHLVPEQLDHSKENSVRQITEKEVLQNIDENVPKTDDKTKPTLDFSAKCAGSKHRCFEQEMSKNVFNKIAEKSANKLLNKENEYSGINTDIFDDKSESNHEGEMFEYKDFIVEETVDRNLNQNNINTQQNANNVNTDSDVDLVFKGFKEIEDTGKTKKINKSKNLKRKILKKLEVFDAENDKTEGIIKVSVGKEIIVKDLTRSKLTSQQQETNLKLINNSQEPIALIEPFSEHNEVIAKSNSETAEKKNKYLENFTCMEEERESSSSSNTLTKPKKSDKKKLRKSKKSKETPNRKLEEVSDCEILDSRFDKRLEVFEDSIDPDFLNFRTDVKETGQFKKLNKPKRIKKETHLEFEKVSDLSEEGQKPIETSLDNDISRQKPRKAKLKAIALIELSLTENNKVTKESHSKTAGEKTNCLENSTLVEKGMKTSSSSNVLILDHQILTQKLPKKEIVNIVKHAAIPFESETNTESKEDHIDIGNNDLNLTQELEKITGVTLSEENGQNEEIHALNLSQLSGATTILVEENFAKKDESILLEIDSCEATSTPISKDDGNIVHQEYEIVLSDSDRTPRENTKKKRKRTKKKERNLMELFKEQVSLIEESGICTNRKDSMFLSYFNLMATSVSEEQPNKLEAVVDQPKATVNSTTTNNLLRKKRKLFDTSTLKLSSFREKGRKSKSSSKKLKVNEDRCELEIKLSPLIEEEKQDTSNKTKTELTQQSASSCDLFESFRKDEVDDQTVQEVISPLVPRDTKLNKSELHDLPEFKYHEKQISPKVPDLQKNMYPQLSSSSSPVGKLSSSVECELPIKQQKIVTKYEPTPNVNKEMEIENVSNEKQDTSNKTTTELARQYSSTCDLFESFYKNIVEDQTGQKVFTIQEENEKLSPLAPHDEKPNKSELDDVPEFKYPEKQILPKAADHQKSVYAKLSSSVERELPSVSSIVEKTAAQKDIHRDTSTLKESILQTKVSPQRQSNILIQVDTTHPSTYPQLDVHNSNTKNTENAKSSRSGKVCKQTRSKQLKDTSNRVKSGGVTKRKGDKKNEKQKRFSSVPFDTNNIREFFQFCENKRKYLNQKGHNELNPSENCPVRVNDERGGIDRSLMLSKLPESGGRKRGKKDKKQKRFSSIPFDINNIREFHQFCENSSKNPNQRYHNELNKNSVTVNSGRGRMDLSLKLSKWQGSNLSVMERQFCNCLDGLLEKLSDLNSILDFVNIPEWQKYKSIMDQFKIDITKWKNL